MGQTLPVTTIRYVVQDSIEEVSCVNTLGKNVKRTNITKSVNSVKSRKQLLEGLLPRI